MVRDKLKGEWWLVMLGKGIFLAMGMEFRDCENDDATLGQVLPFDEGTGAPSFFEFSLLETLECASVADTALSVPIGGSLMGLITWSALPEPITTIFAVVFGDLLCAEAVADDSSAASHKNSEAPAEQRPAARLTARGSCVRLVAGNRRSVPRAPILGQTVIVSINRLPVG